MLAKAPEGYLKEAAAALDASAGMGRRTRSRDAGRAGRAGAGLNRTKGWQPIRAAVTGSNVSPPLPESLAAARPRAHARRASGRPRDEPRGGGRGRDAVADRRRGVRWATARRARTLAVGARDRLDQQAADRLEADPVRREAQGRDGGVLEASLRHAHLAPAPPAGHRRALHRRHVVRGGVEHVRGELPARRRAARHVRALHHRHGRHDLPTRARSAFGAATRSG